jgi:hypothetical protein
MNQQHTGLSSWLCERYVQRPLLPTNVLFCPPEEVGLLPFLLKELHDKLPAPPLLVRAVDGPY